MTHFEFKKKSHLNIHPIINRYITTSIVMYVHGCNRNLYIPYICTNTKNRYLSQTPQLDSILLYLQHRKTRKITYVQGNIEVRSRNHCYRGLHTRMLKCICNLTYPAWKAHGQYYIVTCGLEDLIYFSPLSHKRHNFREKSY
jgi:hypothetical protein